MSENLIVPALKEANVTGKNAVFSPVSLEMCLGMLLRAAGPDWCAKHGYSIPDIAPLWDLPLDFANGEWHSPHVSPDQALRTVLTDLFRAKAEEFPGNPQATATAINSWVSDATKGRITNLVDAQMIDNALVIFVNTTLLKAKWKQQFDIEETSDGIFRTPAGNVTVAFMHDYERDGTLYASNVLAESVKLPLKGKRVAQLLLPASGVSMDRLLDHLDEARTQPHRSRTVSLTIPRLDVSGTTDCGALLDLHEIALEAYGLKNGPVLIKQVAKLHLDEKGIVAVAATVAIMALGVSMTTPFTADRPFVLLIEEKDDTISFAAVVNNPAE